MARRARQRRSHPLPMQWQQPCNGKISTSLKIPKFHEIDAACIRKHQSYTTILCN
ncbi:MAG: hypothetical protein F6K65_15120 [Moorea sp. SIO3C2]|nr:hypothetical protein [Moorena sp. SIO3C2]